MVLIYMPVVTNRVKYTIALCFTEIIGVEFELTDSVDDYAQYNGPKICYASNPLQGGIFIHADELLFAKGIKHFTLTVSEFKGLPTIYNHEDTRSALPFDIFAAAFFMVTRYEEFLANEKDKYGRFKITESIAETGNFVGIPVVNLWAKMLYKLLDENYPGIPSNPRKFTFIPTIDIDHAYAYGHRNLARILGGYLRDLKRTDFATIKERTLVVAGNRKDPYDTYDYINEIHEHHGLKPLYFILFADYGGSDNQVSLKDPAFQELVHRLDKDGGVGIHPSLASNRRFNTLEEEVFGLADLLDRDILFSRQHFLKVKLPWTYRHLLRIGIMDDFSMGYASTPGFRAGIASPFFYFDIITDEITDLLIHPVSVMDVTFRDYLSLNREESIDMIKKMIDIVRSVDGEFVSLWHNESFSDTGRWKGWNSVYEEMLQYALR